MQGPLGRLLSVYSLVFKAPYNSKTIFNPSVPEVRKQAGENESIQIKTVSKVIQILR